MGDLGKDEEVGKNGDARQRGNIGKDTKIRNILKKKKKHPGLWKDLRALLLLKAGRWQEQGAEGLEWQRRAETLPRLGGGLERCETLWKIVTATQPTFVKVVVSHIYSSLYFHKMNTPL